MREVGNYCPVCGFKLWFEPWDYLSENSASHEICPCCFTEFGFDDWADGNPNARPAIWDQLRKEWIDGGMKWGGKHSESIKKYNHKFSEPPENWDPVEQLKEADLLN
ncbi:MAG: hypothetical protein JRN20_22090 [Nitrososphaerota archaeon]|nr:hypothetical protein [Nitrososphaerota archaeon]